MVTNTGQVIGVFRAFFTSKVKNKIVILYVNTEGSLGSPKCAENTTEEEGSMFVTSPLVEQAPGSC